jgi:thymidylate kinase
MSYLLILRGPLGVGKSTVAARLADALGAEVVSVDRLLEDHGLEEWDADRISLRSFLRANDLAVVRAAENRRAERPTLVEGNFYWAEQVDDLIARVGVPSLVVRLEAPFATCLERDAGRPEPPAGGVPRAGNRMGEQAVRDVYAFVAAVDRGIPVDASGTVSTTVRRVRAIVRTWEAGPLGPEGEASGTRRSRGS